MAANVKPSYFTIDWADFRKFLHTAIFEDVAEGVKLDGNRRHVLQHMIGGTWAGFTRSQLKSWITKGYESEILQGLEDMTPPMREKRRWIFSEDGDEYFHDMAISGDDNYMGSWTKRESIPGVAIEAGIMFSSAVKAETVAAYTSWICQVAYSLESSGVDCEITLDFPTVNLNRRESGRVYHNIVRVKKEMEATDFYSWSPMLSPAALRCFGFCIGYLHADRDNFVASSTFGNGMPERRDWKVVYDSERRVIVIENKYMSSSEGFPEERMTEEFRNVLREMQGK